jgi:steroid delta-isomerase-like uncharacterized protein
MSLALAAEVTREWRESLNRHDPAAFAALYAPDTVVRDPSYREPLEGRDAVQRDVEAFFRAFPDVEVTYSTTIEADGVHAVEALFVATHLGPLVTDGGEIPASGARIALHTAGFSRLDGQGRILEERRYYDLAGLAAQLGAE